MARIRSVHPGMATDEAYMAMTFEAKAGWVLLWSQCDDNGVFEWKPISLKASIFPGNNVDFDALLTEWLRLNCIKKIEVGGKVYGLVRNFCLWQRPQKPKFRYPLPDEHRGFVGPRHVKSGTDTVLVSDESDTSTGNLVPRKEEGGKRKDEGGMGDEESESVVAAQQDDGEREFSQEVLALATKIAEIIGLHQSSVMDISGSVENWLEHAPAEYILIAIERVTIERRSRGQIGPPRSMKYYANAIRDVVAEFSRPLPVVALRKPNSAVDTK